MPPHSIGLIGDFDSAVVAHSAIPTALRLASEDLGESISFTWLPTEGLAQITETSLHEYAGFWCVPGSPYQDMDGALHAIRFARENRKPFLGTCGGFQHAVIEYARSVLGLTQADHLESNPNAELPLITALAFRLEATTGKLILIPGTKIAAIYGATEIEEIYNCGFGFNRACADLLRNTAMKVAGVDEAGEIRVVEIPDHPFVIATQYQPERSALAGRRHPLIAGFVQAAAEGAAGESSPKKDRGDAIPPRRWAPIGQP
jgi:CTP synthase (UTP-ammonia lyase)